MTYKTIVLKSETRPDIIFVFCCPNIRINDICFVIGRLVQAGPHGKLHSRLSQHLCCTMKSADMSFTRGQQSLDYCTVCADAGLLTQSVKIAVI